MVVNEFLSSIENFVSFANTHNYISKFTQLAQVVSSARTNLTGTWREEVNGIINELTALTVSHESDTGFPFDKNSTFELLGIQPAMGIGNLAVLAASINNDVIGSEEKVNMLSQRLQKTLEATNNIRGSLNSLSINMVGGYYLRPANESIVVVRFPENETTSNDPHVASTQINDFYTNLQLFGRIDKEARQVGYRIHSISKSSPLSAEIVAWSGVGFAVTLTVNAILIGVEKIQKIRLLEEQIKELKLNNASKISELLKAEEDELASASKTAIEDIETKLGLSKREHDGENPQKAIEKGVKYIQNLIVNGGEVFVHMLPQSMPESDDQPRDLIEMRKQSAIVESTYKETKKLKSGHN